MKKQLLCTSAIALGVAAAAPASAQDWDVSWGGFMNAHVAFVDHGGNTGATDFDGLKTFTTGEIIFTPSITADNGLTFGANVQFEAQNQTTSTTRLNSDIDETYVFIDGDAFGRVLIGAENSAGYIMSTGAPSVGGIGINSPSISAFLPLSGVVPFNFRQAGISSFTEVAGNNDINRITYITPRFNGIQFGVSYAPNNNGGNGGAGSFNGGTQIADNSTATLEDIWDIGVNYSQTFGTTSVALSARYGEGSGVGARTDADVWALGFNVGFGDFAVGGSYAENDNGSGAAGNQGVDQTGWSLGVSYDMPGPWAFSLDTYQGEYDNSGTGGADEEYQAYQLAGSRELAPGVAWDIYIAYAEAKDKGNSALDQDGTVLGTAIKLSF
ncbi:porin [Roseovarius sp. 2305UL8-3]|uniref:porin n=1 Tax=Roseovarius conchicola TaxID=3121636 RepID=UPI0035288572